MRFSYATTLVLSALALALGSPGAVLAGGFEHNENFHVLTPTLTTEEEADRFAREVLSVAEAYRKKISSEWLSEELPDGIGRTTINVSFSDRTFGLTWAKDSARRNLHTLYLSVPPGGEYDRVLAHEMVHVVLATRFPHPQRLPAWLEEGIASRYDDEARQATRRRIVSWWTKTENWPKLAEVFVQENIVSDDQAAYATAASVVEFLLERGDRNRLIQFAADSRTDVAAALETHYRIDGVAELESQWRSWVVAESPRREAADRTALGNRKDVTKTIR